MAVNVFCGHGGALQHGSYRRSEMITLMTLFTLFTSFRVMLFLMKACGRIFGVIIGIIGYALLGGMVFAALGLSLLFWPLIGIALLIGTGKAIHSFVA